MTTKQLTIRVNNDNYTFLREIQTNSAIIRLSINQILNTILTEYQRGANFLFSPSETNQVEGDVDG